MVLLGDILLWLTYAGAGAMLFVVAVVDARTHRIPNKIVLPAYPLVVGLLLVSTVLTGRWAAFWASLGCGAGLWALYYLWGMVKAGSLGFGDVKLAGILGLLLGYVSVSSAVLGTMFAFISAALFGISLLLLRRANKKTAIPFGPFMIGGAAAALAVFAITS
jgi:leader peptidase (prepilin peptidase)/N-methyltransferase